MKVGVIYHNPDLPIHINIGDDIQTIGAINILREICGDKLELVYIDRENISEFYAPEPVVTIMQWWWMHNTASWPPSSSIEPIFIGFHVSHKFRNFITQNPDSLNYFKDHEPIWCRDEMSYQFFTKKWIRAYLSGCLSIFQVPQTTSLNRDTIFLVDAPEVLSFLPADITNNVVSLSHRIGFNNLNERLSVGQKLIDLYFSRGKIIITSKLHCALPCIAMGLSVIVLSHKKTDDRLDLLKLFTKNIFFYPFYFRFLKLFWFWKRIIWKNLCNQFPLIPPKPFLKESQQNLRNLIRQNLRKHFSDIDFS